MSHSESAVPTGGGDEEIASALPNAEHAHDQVRHQPLADPNPDQERLQEATEALDLASLAADSTIEKSHQRNSEDGAEVAPLPSSSHCRQLNEEITPTTPPSLASPKGEQPVTDSTTVAVHLNIDGKDEGKGGNHSTDTVTSSIVRPIPPLHPLRTSASRKSLATRTASRSPVRTGSPSTSYIKPTPPPSPRVTQASLSPPHTGVFSSLRKSLDDAVESLPDTMVFGMSAERRRRVMTNTSALTEYEADLSSKDRTRQKIAIQKYLAQRVRADWDWQWPAAKGSDHETKPTEVNVARTADGEERWKQRDGWEDDTFTSDTEPETVNAVSPTSPTSPNSPGRIDSAISKAMSTPLTPPASKPSPFRFESPDGVGVVVEQKEKERKRRRKKLEAEEMTENDGLKCFIERRNAWTCARRVPSRSSAKSNAPKAESATSVIENGSSTAVDSEDPDNDHVESDWEYDTEVPIAPPILPVENGMRASITPSAYTTIYDKVIVQSLTPACPINLRDVLNSCVQGWQRDGEWYGPKPTVTEGLGRPLGVSTKKKRRKGSLAGILGFASDGDLNGGTSPKSPGFGVRLKSVLGLGKAKKDEPNENNDAHENGNGNVNTGTV